MQASGPARQSATFPQTLSPGVIVYNKGKLAAVVQLFRPSPGFDCADADSSLRNTLKIQFSKAAICIALMGLTARAQTVNIGSEARAIDEHYNRLHSLQAEFVEIYRGSGIERTESGTLWLKKPGKMRWEYRSPREKLFVSDGKNAWFYVPADQQARKTPVSQLDDIRSPLAFLLGKTKLEKELHGLSFAPDLTPVDSGDVILRGQPKGMEERVSSVLLEVTPEHQIRRIIINDVDGSSTEYRFSQMRENRPAADGQFQFRPPSGTETIDGNLGP